MKKVKIILISPDDVSKETLKLRETVLNVVNAWAQISNVRFEPIHAKFNLYPSVDNSSQELVINQIGDEYSILTALFWYKLGRINSKGYSEEVLQVDHALLRSKSKKDVNVQLYFKTRVIPNSEINYSQQTELYEIRNGWSKKGAHYSEFTSQPDLVEQFIRHLALWVEQSYFVHDKTDKQSKEYLETAPTTEVSAAEYMLKFNDESESSTLIIRKISVLMSENAQAVYEGNAELTNLLELPKSSRVEQKITTLLRKSDSRSKAYSKRLNPQITALKTIFVKRFDLYSAALLASAIGTKSDRKMMRDISALIPDQISIYTKVLGAIEENIESSKGLVLQLGKSPLAKTEQKVVDTYISLKTTVEDHIRILKETKKISDKLIGKKRVKIWRK